MGTVCEGGRRRKGMAWHGKAAAGPGRTLTCQVLVHSLHFHLGSGKRLLDGPVLVFLQGLHLLQHLPVGPLQL